jgi:enoyl-CoA hydratase/carnithine racemase
MQAVKQLLSKHASRRLDEELEDAIKVNTLQRSAADFKEGVQAFLERRRANWPSSREKA